MKTVIIGGFVDYQIQLAKALEKSGEAMVVLYAMTRSLPEENLRIGDGVRLWLLAREGPIYSPLVLARFARDFARTLREIRRFRPDVVHFQIGSPILALFMPFLRGYPVVTTFHDVTPHAGEEKAIERYTHRYIRRASRQLLVHGLRLRRLLTEEYGVPVEKANAIPIGPHNVDAFRMHAREGREGDGQVVLFFGRIVDYKGLEHLIRAEPLISAAVPGARIVIAGAGDMRKYEPLMVHRERFEVRNRHIPYDEGAELFQRCRVVALPYTEASQSGVVSTAYGFGKPVVATDTGSIPEIVDDGVTGLIVPPRDHEALAAALIRILEDPAYGKQLGENGRRKLYTDMSWDNVVRQTLVVYRKAIDAGPGRDRADSPPADARHPDV